MAEPSHHERRQHFRGKPRPGRRLPVRWRPGGAATNGGHRPPNAADTASSTWISTETRNIGIGGAFIAADDPPPVGAELIVELHLPTSELPFEVRASVRWRRPGDIASGAGMGVQFLSVDMDVLLELNDYFASLTGEETGDAA